MSILTTDTYAEMMELVNDPAHSYAVQWRVEARLLVDGEDIILHNVTRLQRISEYANRYYGDHFISIDVDPIVHKRIVDNTNKIQIEVTRVLQSMHGEVTSDERKHSQLFNAHLLNPSNNDIKAVQSIAGANGDHVDMSSALIPLDFQLVEPIIAKFRTAETGGIFKDTAGMDMDRVLRYTLGFEIPKGATKEMLSDPHYLGIRGVDVVQPSNTRLYQHVVIPNLTRLTDVPRYLQETYGIYSSGLGWHIERGRCFIYPLLDYTQYGKRHKMITILNIPVSEVPTMERTFMARANELYIFATGHTGHIDITENTQLNAGNGIRFTLSGNLIDNMSTTSENKTTYVREDNVESLVLDKRPDGVENVRHVKSRFTDNPYRDTSKTAIGLGTEVIVNWEHANPDLLYPGMPVKMLFKSEGVVISLVGTLMGTEVTTVPHTDSILDNAFITAVRMTLFVIRIPEVESRDG